MTVRNNDSTRRDHLRLGVKSILRAFSPGARPEEKTVVFVAGVQRSGTNVMIDILERSLETDVFRESDPRAFRNYELISLDRVRELVNTSKSKFIIFKSLCEIQDLRKMLDAFPQARAIWMLRRMQDMVNSHLHTFFVSSSKRICNQRMLNILEDPNSEGWRGRGLAEETRTMLATAIHPDISHESAVALFWFMRNRIYFDHGLEQDHRVRVVPYESLAGAPQQVGLKLLDWLGLKRDTAILSKVHARSIGKHPPPPLEDRVVALCRSLEADFLAKAQIIGEGQ